MSGAAVALRPRKQDGVEIRPAADGFVIHQGGRDRVHYLNRTAVLILELCDGEATAAMIAEWLQNAFDLPELPLDLVNACLKRLAEESLVA